MTLTDRGVTVRNWIVGLTLSALLFGVLATAYSVGQAWKQERLTECVHGKAGWTCPEGTTP